jgi:co-chaperonin GroES (HSP10)
MKVSNTSGLEPAGRAVLLEPYEPERKGSLIEIPEFAKEKTFILESRAIVIAIGPAAWDDEKVPRAAVGDIVMVSGFSGRMVKGPADGKWYRCVNDRDLFIKVKEPVVEEARKSA